MIEPEFIDVDGRRQRYRAAGAGRPVVLIHGISRSLEDWDEVFDELAESTTVYAIDLPGYGESGPIKHAGLREMAEAVWRFLDVVGVSETPILVGNSLGGAVAQQMAALQPKRVAGLVLVDSAGFGSEVTPALRMLGVPVVGRLALRPSRKRAELTMSGILYNKELRTKERIDHAFALASRPGGAKVMLQTARSLGNWRGIHERWRTELLAQVTPLGLPVLLMWGEKDLILPAKHIEAAKTAYPDARAHVFPKTGHMPQIEHPHEFIVLVHEFLAETTKERP